METARHGGRARRHGLHLPRGHPDPHAARWPSPKRGVGRLALQTGAPVVPAAVLGTEHVRRGWRIRPRKVQGAARQGDDLPARRASPRRRWPRP